MVVANLLYSVVRCIPRNLVTESNPYTILKELIMKETDLSDYQRSEKLHALPALVIAIKNTSQIIKISKCLKTKITKISNWRLNHN